MGLLDALFGPSEEELQRRREAEETSEMRLYEIYANQMVRLYTVYLQSAEEKIESAVRKHAETLVRRREELVTVGDYGELDATAWRKEVDYFVRQFADFEDDLTAVEELIEEERAEGRVSDDLLDHLLRQFTDEVPVATVEAALGLRPRRKRSQLDRDAQQIRSSARARMEADSNRLVDDLDIDDTTV